jgi:beta-lactamase class A
METNQYMKIVGDTISASKLLGIEYGIAFIDLKESKNTFFHQESEIFEVGSVIKICILVEVLTRFQNKTIDLDER